MAKPRALRFGIQSLDKLIGTINYKENQQQKKIFGVDLSELVKSDKDPKPTEPITSSICLTGPDGTGKSLLSLHIASQYLADCLGASIGAKEENYSVPKVFHISTDLTYPVALKGWNQFALDRPFQRREPLVELTEGRRGNRGSQARIRIDLKQYFPAGDATSDKSIINYLEREPSINSRAPLAKVCFVDLASRTAGDDWGFVHRLLSTLEQRPNNDARHLVVLDAVEGFETLAGDLNAFGEKSSRRSRIAQVMRLAAGKTHLVFVVEEAREERFPEEFVADVVVRLRNVSADRYSRRTVEIDKGRGQWSIRGQHPYVIRNGEGSTTGTQINADEPKVADDAGKFQSYVHVFPSLNYISRDIMIDKYNPRDRPPINKFAGFGITYLDSMLASAAAGVAVDRFSDEIGLPAGTTAALIGDSLTQKSQLGRAFLSRSFYPYAKELSSRIIEAVAGRGRRLRTCDEIRQSLRPSQLGKGHPVTVMFTTQGMNNEQLADDFYEWLAAAVGGTEFDGPEATQAFRAELQQHIKFHTICRRFEIHDVPSPILMHIFQRNIEQAQRIMFGVKDTERLPEQSQRFLDSWRVRVVIDDLNGFRNIFPEMLGDPLMLPSLLFMLRREGVTALIIDTQTSGSPELSITERFDSSVRELVQHRIYTWRLPFYGENRVAISLIPPLSQESPGVIRELRWETRAELAMDRSLRVDPHFELYMGLEKGRPEPVPLEVRLYAETPSFKRYIQAEEKFFSEIFRPVATRVKQDEVRVISWVDVTDYDALRDSSRLQRDTRLDHTTILQVDEFWWLRRATQRRAGAFRQQWGYLNAITAEEKDVAEAVADPFGVFQPPSRLTEAEFAGEQKSTTENGEGKKTTKRRLDFFDDSCGYGFQRIKENKEKGETSDEEHYIDRVPFTWDFGFMLCNGKAWEEAKDHNPKVKTVWHKLCKHETPTEKGKAARKTRKTSTRKPVSWRDFLAASKIVAEYQAYRTSAPATAFDFTMLSPEAFSCLILEMWVSEIYRSLSKAAAKCRKALRRKDLSRTRRKYLANQKRDLDQTRQSILRRVSQRRWYPQSGDHDQLDTKTLLVALINERPLTLSQSLEQRVKAGSSDRKSKGKLPERTGGYSLELYKVWLLLIEALNFADLVDNSSHLNFEFKSRDVSNQAVSARHWYKTASKFIDSLTPEQLEYNWVPARLPGHFSVRADWFLAVAGGSRSSRLADHALDLLSSQRANITRLQEGVGLPTRSLVAENVRSRLRTRLISVRTKGQPLVNVQYEELRHLGAPKQSDSNQGQNSEQFYWLWRSGIWAYNRHSRIWHKWLNRSLLNWHSWRQRYGSTWKSGFDVYDMLDEIEFGDKDDLAESLSKLSQLDSWKDFHELRNILITELEQVSISAV